MSTSVISGLIGGLVSAAIIAWWTVRARNHAEFGVLRYGVGLIAIGVLCLIVVGFATGAFLLDDDVRTGRGALFAVVGFVVAFGLGAVYCFVEFFFVRGSYDDEGIELHSPWTGDKREKWQHLGSVKFNPGLGWWVLRFQSGSVIRLSIFLSGHGGVLYTLEDQGIALE